MPSRPGTVRGWVMSNERKPNPQLTERMTRAFDMAREVHVEQSLKGTTLPYLLHLLDVCSIALRHGADEDQAIAALLHDAVEDGGGEDMAVRIGAAFGDRVEQIVRGCSDSTVSNPAKKKSWWDRKIIYIDHLPSITEDVAFVAAADKLSNARSIVAEVAEHRDAAFEKFSTKRVGTLWYYRSITDVLPARLPKPPGAQRLGMSLTKSVAEMVDLVGAEAAEADWELALDEVARVRGSV